MNKLIHHISDLLNEQIKSLEPVSAGDISQAFLLESSHNRYFIKVNSSSNALAMFKAEQMGLESIVQTNTISVPAIFHSGVFDGKAFLLMEFIESKPASSKDFERLGSELANLHQVTSDQFGFEKDSFIGNLPQSNNSHNTWVDFYINERLNPQFLLAISRNLIRIDEIPNKEQMKETLNNLFKNVKPSLLHGDLWSGNFLIATDGTPYLIDPAAYYGHNEVDIAMSKLFGGFDSSFYEAYHEIHPKTSETPSRIEIYQLYYLLVHLNLFGSSYYDSVKGILNKYF